MGPEGDARQWQWPGDYDTEWCTRTGSVMGQPMGGATSGGSRDSGRNSFVPLSVAAGPEVVDNH